MDSESQLDQLRLLMSYQEACQRFDVEAAVAFFSDNGTLELGGEQHTGRAALLDAQRWDRAARNQVAFLEPKVSEDRVTLTFVNQHELHRILGVEAIRSPAEMVIRDGRIHLFRILIPEPGSLQALQEKAGPFFTWVRQHRWESWQETAALDKAGGQALYELAHAWRRHNDAAA
jgi:hypothetical protein